MLDVALNNGRLIDPAGGIDKTASIGFQNGRVKIISDLPLIGRQVFDVRGSHRLPGLY
jgi:predicted amidohydrolase